MTGLPSTQVAKILSDHPPIFRIGDETMKTRAEIDGALHPLYAVDFHHRRVCAKRVIRRAVGHTNGRPVPPTQKRIEDIYRDEAVKRAGVVFTQVTS
ncbi:hypothetical protein A3F03_03535 [Candidatus Roizmanbacteria bacterium RIFCSPHIGHO2_12_FULL_41_11]|nr:MAG: hypothetical protein A3F03_03535 [Candidatus Roizmanbacteria bacterium RIFCSPHIGHO2_12_FULL_41_11]OGK51247.1 MAG: hypothetical protein A2966_03445 [Candidatus Roizmanbacteria bacterium RIFCSPLOWO2_01_FULL_41_22]